MFLSSMTSCFGSLSPERRAELVRAALQDDGAQIASWHERGLYGAGFAGSLTRVAGEALLNDRMVDWSLVVKVFVCQSDGLGAGSTDPAAWNYWKREWDAYQAGWLQEQDAAVVPARCLGAGDDVDSGTWVALEDLTSLDCRPWTVPQLRAAARNLGSFGAPYLVGRPLPGDTWLSSGWLRGWTQRAADQVQQLEASMEQPVVRQMLSASLATKFVHLWRHRLEVFEAMEALPQTFCHHDFFPRNVFLRPGSQGEQCVAVDWAFCGRGAVGEDLAGLVGSAMIWFEVDPADADEVEAACLIGYLEGLRSHGWDGNPDDVLLAYLARNVLGTGLGGLAPALAFATDKTSHAPAERAFGRPPAVIARNIGATFDVLERQLDRMWTCLAAR